MGEVCALPGPDGPHRPSIRLPVRHRQHSLRDGLPPLLLRAAQIPQRCRRLLLFAAAHMRMQAAPGRLRCNDPEQEDVVLRMLILKTKLTDGLDPNLASLVS